MRLYLGEQRLSLYSRDRDQTVTLLDKDGSNNHNGWTSVLDHTGRSLVREDNRLYEKRSSYKRREAVTREEKRLSEKRSGYERREEVIREEKRL